MLSVVIVLLLLISMSVPVFADVIETKDNKTIVFLDAEGKANNAEIHIEESGVVVVDYYIEGIWNNTATVELSGDDSLVVTVQSVDVETNTTYRVNVSEFLSSVETVIEERASTLASTTSDGYTKMGTVSFTPHTVGSALGIVHRHKLESYSKLSKTVRDYRTFNTTAGTLASVAIGALASVLTTWFVGAAPMAEGLFWAIVSSVGGTVVGGVVQEALSETYYTETDYYYVKVVDPDSGNSHNYSGEHYGVLLPGTMQFSDWQRARYYNWDSSNTISLVYDDFWDCQYPGYAITYG